jgi:hypothetical protein
MLIAPTQLLTLNSRTPKHPEGFNPRYFQAYTDRRDENLKMNIMKENLERTVPPDTYDSSQRLLQEFVVRNNQRVSAQPSIPLLSLRRGNRQTLYTDLTKDINTDNYRIPDEDMNEDAAALRIQCCYRGRLGRHEFDAQLKEYERRDRAALRVQCAWRGKKGYSRFILQRAKNHDEQNAAVRLQALIRGREDRRRYLHTRAFMSQQEIMATKIQCAFRGRRDRMNIMRMKRERGSLVATTNKWGESENGLALLVDLSTLNHKFSFSNVMAFTVPAPKDSRDDHLRASMKGGYTRAYEDYDEGDPASEHLLDELKGDSASIAKQLARIEVMAEELEEDFARTGNELSVFQSALNENMGDMRNTKLATRLGLWEKEDEKWQKAEAAKKVATARGHRSGVKEEVATYDEGATAADEAEGDLKECWNLINQLKGQLY